MTNVLGRPLMEPASSTSSVSASSKPLSTNQPRFTLLYSSPSISSLLLIPEIASLQKSNPDKLKVGLWVEDSTRTQRAANESFLGLRDQGWIQKLFGSKAENLKGELETIKGRIGEKDLKQWVGSKERTKGAGRKMILICGPDG